VELILLLILAVAGYAVYNAVSKRSKARAVQTRQTNELSDLKRTAEEDVTRLGEEVADLDTETTGVQLDQGGRQDYKRALDSYDAAKQALDRAVRPDDIKAVTTALEDGRYAIACVQARVAGRPLPQRRPPCFFNPQHGPSAKDVEWAPPGGQPRTVPVCMADAERVEAGAEPDVRQVFNGNRRVPYYNGGPAYAGYNSGYFGGFAGSGLMSGVLVGALTTGLLSSAMGGWGGGFGGGGFGGDGYGDAYQDGYADGQDNDNGDNGDSGDNGDGGGDSGGGDSGGGDFGGGGDWGGGDFGGGGGDFGGGDF